MQDIALYAAGAIGICTAILHGVVGETHVFRTARIEPPRLRLLLRLIWQCGSVAWAAIGALLIAAPFMGSGDARLWIAGAAVATYACAAVGNAWATRLRHPGWLLMAAATGLAIAGA